MVIKKILAIGLVCVLVLGGVGVFSATVGVRYSKGNQQHQQLDNIMNEKPTEKSGNKNLPLYTPHAPISINSNTDFTSEDSVCDGREATATAGTPLFDIVFLLDCSGSMAIIDPLGYRVGATQRFVLNHMRYPDRGALVFFDSDGRAWYAPRSGMNPSAPEHHLITPGHYATLSNPTNYSCLVNDCTCVYARGGTCFRLPLQLGNDELINYSDTTNQYGAKSNTKVMILLTDGKDLHGEWPSCYANEVYRARDNGIKIYTIGLGDVADSYSLAIIASITGGKYYDCPQARNLSQIYDQIYSELPIMPYAPHAPISINSNADFTPANGVVGGSGTQGDPYVIEGWEINASGANGIAIKQTTAYFIINSCYVHGGGSNYSGLSLVHAENGKIVNTTLCENKNGIWLESSNRTVIMSNNITANRMFGIWSLHTSNCTISENVVSSNGYSGVQLELGMQNTVERNSVVGNGRDGINLQGGSKALVANNTLSSNGQAGVYLGHSNNGTIAGNVIQHNLYGMLVSYDSDDNIIANNSITYSTNVGVDILFSSRNTITYNTVSDNGDIGIKLIHSSGFIVSSNYNQITHNEIVRNAAYGICALIAHKNMICHNNFIDNNHGGVQAYDDTGTNFWNDTNGKGNYWSDYPSRYPWATNNGVVWNHSYELAGGAGAKDYYPLVNSVGSVQNRPPTAFIDSIAPNPAVLGQTVTFAGHGTDSDGTVVAYSWRSSIDGNLSAQATFNTSSLSVGTHTIYFKVKDNNGTWSPEVNVTLVVNPPAPPPRYAISGRVYRAGTTQPLAGAKLVLSPGRLNTTTNATGHYSFTALENGMYMLTVSKDGYRNGYANVTVSGANVTQDFYLTEITEGGGGNGGGKTPGFELGVVALGIGIVAMMVLSYRRRKMLSAR